MKITEGIIRKLIKQSLFEAVWSNSPDFDFQADSFEKVDERLKSDRVLFFTKNKEFNFYGADIGMTHEKDSHTLKHMVEFDQNIMLKLCSDITNVIAENYEQGEIDLYYLTKKDLSADVYSADYTAPQVKIIRPVDVIPGDIINTLDRINDDLFEGRQILEFEKMIFFTYFLPVADIYDKMVDDMIEYSVDIGDQNFKTPQAIKQFIDNKISAGEQLVISFVGNYTSKQTGTTQNRYYYNVLTSAMASKKPEAGIATLMRRLKSMNPSGETYSAEESLAYFAGSGSTTIDQKNQSSFYQYVQGLASQVAARKKMEALGKKQKGMLKSLKTKIANINAKLKKANKAEIILPQHPQLGTPAAEQWFQNAESKINAANISLFDPKTNLGGPIRGMSKGYLKGGMSLQQFYTNLSNMALKKYNYTLSVEEFQQLLDYFKISYDLEEIEQIS